MENQNTQLQINGNFFAPIEQKFLKASNLKKEDFEREVSFAVQLIHNNKRLAECDQTSFLKAVMNIANIGLTLNPVSKYAYLVPRYNSSKRINEAYLEPSYIGLVKLLTDSGSVKSITSNLVREGDKFEVSYGLNPDIIHNPVFGSKKPITAVYAVATLADGSKQFEVMTAEEVHEIRARSESFKAYEAKKIPSCVWTTDEGEMFRKTVIKRIYKYLPKSANVQRIEEAINIDNSDFMADGWLKLHIDELMRKSTLSVERKQQIENEMAGEMPYIRATEIIGLLMENQLPTLTQQLDAKLITEEVKEMKK